MGATHWDKLGGGNDLPGPQPVLFFAPEQIRKRPSDWGPAVLQEQAGTTHGKPSWNRAPSRRGPGCRWCAVRGAAAVDEVYGALLDGRTRPEQGHVLTL